MSIPNFDDTQEIELTTDDDLLERVSSLLERANTRQVWLMFLDEEDRQMPLLMPSYVPRIPEQKDITKLGAFFRELTAEVGAATIVPTFERRGSPELSDIDCIWLQALRDACVDAAISFRGPLLCHSSGVRWVPLDEYVEEPCS